jgi:prophage maintenance system killer protein
MNSLRHSRIIAVLCIGVLSLASCKGMSLIPKPAYSNAIKEIPQYVYENCNHMVRHHWTAEEFRRLKALAETVTVIDVRSETDSEDAFVKRCELYDWIYCLNYIERELISVEKITSQHLKHINACLSRLTFNDDGSFRTQGVRWAKRDTVSDTELWFDGFLHRYADRILKGHFTIRFFEGKFSTGQLVYFFKLVRALMNLSLPEGNVPDYAQADTEIISEARSIIAGAQSQKHTWWLSIVKPDGSSWHINPDEVITWEKGLEGTFGYQKGIIHWRSYLRQRYHIFPAPETIEEYARYILNRLNDPTEDSAVISAYIWFKVIAVHLFNRANKRSGKAISLLPLLRNGYLPALIEGQRGEAFVKLLQSIFEKFDADPEADTLRGARPAINFLLEDIARANQLVKQTQQNTCGVCSITKDLKSCSACKKVYYCSVGHQRQHWAQHKKDCQKKL